MKIRIEDDFHAFLLAAACFFLVVVCCWYLWSSQEAAAYNRLTGSSVTTWDAMWVELRVEGGDG